MSYDIIKRIKITEDKKVLVTCASNNVYPHTFEEVESQSLSKILKEQGKEALDIELLRAYESGCFQGGSSKYIRALHILRHLPEYKDFNWRLGGIGKEYDRINKNRANESAFVELFKKALNSKLPKEKFIVSKGYNGSVVYLWKLTKRSARWTNEKTKAKIFNYKLDADNIKTYFENSNDWQTELLN